MNSHQENFLTDINDYRRYSLLAHSIFSIKRCKVEDYLLESENLVSNIDGDTRWVQLQEVFQFGNIFNEFNLFIFESSCDTYFKEINLKNPAT